MTNKTSELYFVLAIIAGVSLLSFFIFAPFLYAIVLALVFATVFEPVRRRIVKRMPSREGTAALLSTLFVAVIIIIPLTFLFMRIFRELGQLYSFFASSQGTASFAGIERGLAANLRRILPLPADYTVDLGLYLRDGLNWFLQHIGLIFSNVARIFIALFIFLIALYYFFKEGRSVRRDLISLSPLTTAHNEIVLAKLELAVNSVIKGSLTVALVQGLVTALGFVIFGVPNAVLFGMVTAMTALVPSIGTGIVIIPAVLYLFFTGNVVAAVGMLVWGIVAVGLIDNFLGPKLVEKGTKMHPFLILLSILGGISLFGPLGFVLGPLTLALLFAFFDVYKLIRENERTASN
jgi:predicted PurR-regulated permease PerM